jgi:hypothetical protein
VPDSSDDTDGDGRGGSGGGECGGVASVLNEPDDAAADADTESVAAQQLAVYGDAAYGAGPLLARLENAGARIMTKVQPPPALGGRFAKDRFTIDLAADTVTCPGQVSVAIRPVKNGGERLHVRDDGSVSVVRRVLRTSICNLVSGLERHGSR